MVARDEKEIALMMQSSRRLGLSSGMIVGVPNPNPADSMTIQLAINDALAKASTLEIEGAKVTPFVLAEVERLTQGRSLEANITLVLNNARVASNIAKSLLSISTPPISTNTADSSSSSSSSSSSHGLFNSSLQLNQRVHNDVVVIGGSVIDIVSTASNKNVSESKNYPGLIMKSSNPGTMKRSVGGVGRNVATAVSRLRDGVNVCLLSVTAEDSSGAEIMNDLSKRCTISLRVINPSII
jgi:pseudouridylate synthase / pseudouridine kinase